jgi:hypothetical protein
MDITGMGMDELLRFFDQKQSEMSQLTGMGLNIDAHFGGKVHNEYRERDPWDERYDGPQPGNLDAGKVKEIMNERDYNR